MWRSGIVWCWWESDVHSSTQEVQRGKPRSQEESNTNCRECNLKAAIVSPQCPYDISQFQFIVMNDVMALVPLYKCKAGMVYVETYRLETSHWSKLNWNLKTCLSILASIEYPADALNKGLSASEVLCLIYCQVFVGLCWRDIISDHVYLYQVMCPRSFVLSSCRCQETRQNVSRN